MHIDWWTLTLQAVNVLILIWLLGRFFYRPLAAIIEKRRAAAANLLAEAEAARAAAESEKAAIAATRQGFAAEREKILADAHKQAQADRDAMLKDAAAAAEKSRAENAAALALDRKAMEVAARHRAGALAVDIARKLLEKLPADAIAAGFVEGLRHRLCAMPPKSLDLLRATAGDKGIDIMTAAPADDAIKEQCRRMLETALATNPRLAYHCDPQLIAGIEIRTDAMIVGNDWRNDLTRILQELAAGDAQR